MASRASTTIPPHRLRRMSFSFDVFGPDPDPVVHDVETAASDCEPVHRTSPANPQRAGNKEAHERRVVRPNANLAVESGRDHRVGLIVEHRRFWGDNRDLHHELPSFSALATASSMPPTM